MKVAFTSSTGEQVDQHFGHTDTFHLWDIGPDQAAPAGTVRALVEALDHEDQTMARASALAGCTIVYTQQIGGPAAAKLVAHRIHPMKTGATVPVGELITKLQEVLRGKPPPWLRKAMAGAEAAPFTGAQFSDEE